ncbi:MAG: alpha-L-fucosidase [Pseudopedobacter saltans]|uniref:alpha-L-fucosidase n=1 Tax=Pseudopedobacter saltans TaxID=151895 RepID=A0A2W5F5N4_9SPHI|nr:MAG: alpha-L-fucosidase [Pseudopedobacter saltans]
MKKIVFFIVFISLALVSFSQNTEKENRMKWWKEARFGLFIHWGVYAQWAGVYHGHNQAKGGAEWIMNRCKIPVEEYQDTAKSFNPVNYNPDAWVKMAKDAGMKYIVITAKHHDGFALFKSEASKWNVVDATPYGKDLLKPLAEACKKYGIKLGFYYSQAQDWNNPGGSAARKEMKEGWPNPDSTKIDAYTKAHNGHWDPAQETRSFSQYIKDVSVPQVRELLTNYEDVSIIWWDTPTNMTDEAAKELSDLLKLQPNIISNNRLKRPNFPGDFGTPEQKIPDAKELDGVDWESCMTMNGTWGYKSWDHNWKSTEKLIQSLVDAASKGGNFLLNIGPKPDGSIPTESTQRLDSIGKWMDKNSEAIYETTAGPIIQPEWGRCTMKHSDNKTILYLFLFKIPENNEIVLPGIQNKVIKSQILNGNHLYTSIKNGNAVINTKMIDKKTLIPVIKLELKGEVVNLNQKSKNTMQTKELD